MKFSQVSLIGSALLVAGCGGGGGGGGFVRSTPIPINFQAANTTVAYQTPSAAMTVDETSGATTQINDASGAGGTVTIITTAGGNLGGIVFNTNTPTTAFSQSFFSFFPTTDPIPIDTIASGLNSVIASGAGTPTAFLQQAPGLTSSAYGLWAVQDTATTERIGAFAIGSLTPGGSVPTTGNATYTGNTLGAVTKGTAEYALTGTMTLNATFAGAGAGSVLATISNINLENVRTGDTATTLAGLTGVAGATIAGTAAIGLGSNAFATAGAGGFAGTGLTTGALNGNFYGAVGLAPAEAAGTWNASGNGVSAIGAFGAKCSVGC